MTDEKKIDYRRLIVHKDEIMPFVPKGREGVSETRALIEPDGVGSKQLYVTQFTLNPYQSTNPAFHPEGCDEVYYVLKGQAIVRLGGNAKATGAYEGERRPGSLVFIPAGTYHSLVNNQNEKFEILTVWASMPPPGANSGFDGRKKLWGTTFKKIEDHA